MLRGAVQIGGLLTLLAVGCRSGAEPEPEPTPATVEKTVAPPPIAAAPPRIPAFEAPELPAGDGFVDGGLIYAAVRTQTVLPFLQRLPLPPEMTRDLAEIGSALGMDLRVDDIPRRFGLAPDGVITMTLFRPMDGELDTIRNELSRDSGVIEALSRPRTPPPTGDTLIPTNAIVPEDPPPAPPPLAPETIAKAETLRRHAAGLGFHLRIHAPATDPTKLPALVEAQQPRRSRTMYDVMCGAIPKARSCIGERDFVVIFRDVDGALVVDVVAFALDDDADIPTRVAAVREAVLARPADHPVLSQLHGDAAAYVDAGMLARLGALDGVRSAWQAMQWASPDDRSDTVRRRLERVESLERQRDAPLMFEGVTAEATVNEERIGIRLRWVVVPSMREEAQSLLAAPRSYAPAPALAALCEEAVLCGRTRGLPSLSALGEKLGTGVYAESSRDFQRTWKNGREWSLAHTVLATWPNILGSAGRWISQAADSGPQAALVTTAVESAQRVEGAGFSLLRGPKDDEAPLFIAYVRGPETPILAARPLLDLAGMTGTEKTVDGATTPLRWYEVGRELGIGISIDPTKLDTADGPTSYGWLVATDSAQRFAWLSNLETENGNSPGAYIEAPDLWSLLALDRSLSEDLTFAQTWLSRRHWRAQLTVEDGQPTIVTNVATSPP